MADAGILGQQPVHGRNKGSSVSPRPRRRTMTQPGATKTQKVVPQEPVAETPRREVTEEIRTRAYEIYPARGAAPGLELDDWLQAERELRIRRTCGGHGLAGFATALLCPGVRARPHTSACLVLKIADSSPMACCL